MLSNLLRRTPLQNEHPLRHLLETQSDEGKLFVAFSLKLYILHLKLDLGFQGLGVHEQNTVNPAVAPGTF